MSFKPFSASSCRTCQENKHRTLKGILRRDLHTSRWASVEVCTQQHGIPCDKQHSASCSYVRTSLELESTKGLRKLTTDLHMEHRSTPGDWRGWVAHSQHRKVTFEPVTLIHTCGHRDNACAPQYNVISR